MSLIYKIGNKLLCKTDSVIAGGTKVPYFTKDKYYTIVGFMGFENEILIIENDLIGIVQSPRNVFFKEEIPLNFYTIKDIRREKLKKLNNSIFSDRQPSMAAQELHHCTDSEMNSME